MANIKELIQKASKTQHGFKDIQKAADETVASHSAKENIRIAKELYASTKREPPARPITGGVSRLM
jgi:hypothetical protein